MCQEHVCRLYGKQKIDIHVNSLPRCYFYDPDPTLVAKIPSHKLVWEKTMTVVKYFYPKGQWDLNAKVLQMLWAKFVYAQEFFFFNFWKKNPFLWGHWYPCFGLWWRLPWVSKSKRISGLHAFLLTTKFEFHQYFILDRLLCNFICFSEYQHHCGKFSIISVNMKHPSFGYKITP